LVSTLLGFDLNELPKAKGDEVKTQAIMKKLESLKSVTMEEMRSRMEFVGFLKNGLLMSSYFTRGISIQLRELEHVDAFAVLSATIPDFTETVSNKNPVVQITLKTLPIPDDETPWEKITEFRSDPDSHTKFLAFRNWMNEISRNKLSPIEIEQKLEFLLDQYNQHIKIHRMKANAGTFQTIITTGAELLGDVVSFKWGKAAEALFSLKHRNIALVEGELTAPGNEVAYIVKAQDTFQ
jgi:hypothetical protein